MYIAYNGLESIFPQEGFFLERVYRDPFRNNSGIPNKRRAIAMNALHYLTTIEAKIIERGSERNSTWERAESRNSRWK
mgnify:CR=1 FL=1